MALLLRLGVESPLVRFRAGLATHLASLDTRRQRRERRTLSQYIFSPWVILDINAWRYERSFVSRGRTLTGHFIFLGGRKQKNERSYWYHEEATRCNERNRGSQGNVWLSRGFSFWHQTLRNHRDNSWTNVDKQVDTRQRRSIVAETRGSRWQNKRPRGMKEERNLGTVLMETVAETMLITTCPRPLSHTELNKEEEIANKHDRSDVSITGSNTWRGKTQRQTGKDFTRP